MKTEILSYDWHGINRNGERIITFAKRPMQDGGDYVLDVPEHDRYGHLFAAAPALLMAVRAAADFVEDMEGVGARRLRQQLGAAMKLAEKPNGSV